MAATSVKGFSKATRTFAASLPWWVGAAVYMFVLATGNNLLRDSDIFWQIEVGRWIIDHRAVPYEDVYSFTMKGAPWISSSWLAQIIFAAVFSAFGWIGPVVISSAAAALAFLLFTRYLLKFVDPARVVILAMIALALSMPHLLARPHILALPLMVAWFAGLMTAADRRAAPSLWLLPLIALWANVHGGFVFGLALIAPVALIAVSEADVIDRKSLTLRWVAFAIMALLAACCTPYGWRTLLAARNILDLGDVLTILSEWQPANFRTFGIFEACLLGIFFVALHRGVTLSLSRIILLIALIHLALNHVRSIEAFALLLPIVLAKPLMQESGRSKVDALSFSQRSFALSAIVAVAIAITSLFAVYHPYFVIPSQAPEKALAALQERKVRHILNGYEFGGFLIARGVAPFIDGRAELYGETFVMDHHRAVSLQDIDTLYRLLDEYKIDAALFNPTTPVAQLLDGASGWQKIYADESSAAYVRATRSDAKIPPRS